MEMFDVFMVGFKNKSPASSVLLLFLLLSCLMLQCCYKLSNTTHQAAVLFLSDGSSSLISDHPDRCEPAQALRAARGSGLPLAPSGKH